MFRVPMHAIDQYGNITGLHVPFEEIMYPTEEATPMLSIKTPLPLDKMAVISQTIFSDAFSWMKTFVFCNWQ